MHASTFQVGSQPHSQALSLIPRPLPVYVNGAEFALLTYDRCPDLHAGHIAPMLWSELYGSELYG